MWGTFHWLSAYLYSIFLQWQEWTQGLNFKQSLKIWKVSTHFWVPQHYDLTKSAPDPWRGYWRTLISSWSVSAPSQWSQEYFEIYSRDHLTISKWPGVVVRLRLFSCARHSERNVGAFSWSKAMHKTLLKSNEKLEKIKSIKKDITTTFNDPKEINKEMQKHFFIFHHSGFLTLWFVIK